MCSMPDDHFRYERLGEDHVGVIVLDVSIGDTTTIMNHETWSITKCSFSSGHSLQCTIDHFAALPIAEDLDAYFGGRHKKPYQFLVLKKNINIKELQFIKKTSNVQILKISSGRCYPKHCWQLFPREHTFTIRQRFYLKSFEDQCEYGILARGQMHSIEGDRKRKYLTLHGTEVCVTA